LIQAHAWQIEMLANNKPVLRLIGGQVWYCGYRHEPISGFGMTPLDAFRDMERRRARVTADLLTIRPLQRLHIPPCSDERFTWG
jgi:hypothetical protein